MINIFILYYLVGLAIFHWNYRAKDGLFKKMTNDAFFESNALGVLFVLTISFALPILLFMVILGINPRKKGG